MKVTPIALATIKTALSYIDEKKNSQFKTILPELEPYINQSLDNAGQTFLHFAAGSTSEILTDLINAGSDPNALDNDQWSPLMVAAKEGNAKNCEILLNNGAHVDHRDMGGWSALMWACYKNKPNVVEVLLQHHADTKIREEHGMTPLIWAAGRGYTPIVESLLRYGSKAQVVDKFNSSALLWACRKGFVDCAQLLVQAGAHIDTVGMNGWTPLIAAVRSNNLKLVKLLCDRERNTTLYNHKDKDGMTALALACQNGSLDIVTYLLDKGASPSLTNLFSDTCLILATKNGHGAIVKALLDHNVGTDAQGHNGKTALYWAVDKNLNDIILMLLKHKCDTELINDDGEAPLHRAIHNRNALAVQMLIDAGANVSKPDKKGDTALHISVRMRSRHLTELLLRNPKNSKILYIPNHSGQTPYNIDAQSPHPFLPYLFGAQHLKTLDYTENMLGYDLYSSALSDVLCDPMLGLPLTVGLYAKWGSGKSFLIKKLQDEMKSFTDHMLPPSFKLTRFNNAITFLFCFCPALFIGILFTWEYGLIVFVGLLAITYLFYITLLLAHHFGWVRMMELNEALGERMDKLKLFFQIIYCNPRSHTRNDSLPIGVRFLFTDYAKLTIMGGEKSLAGMMATLCEAAEREFGVLTVRFFRVFHPKLNDKTRTKTCFFIPKYLVTIGVLSCFIALAALLLRIAKDDLASFTDLTTFLKSQNFKILLTLSSIIVLAILVNLFVWKRLFQFTFQSQAHRVLKAADNIDAQKSEGFMQKMKVEVKHLVDLVETIDAFSVRQTRLVVIIDGLDSCEQEKILQVLEAVKTLFSDNTANPNSPFITILAIVKNKTKKSNDQLELFKDQLELFKDQLKMFKDTLELQMKKGLTTYKKSFLDPHIIVRAIESNLSSAFYKSSIKGYEYLRNAVNLPIFLQRQGLLQFCANKIANPELKYKNMAKKYSPSQHLIYSSNMGLSNTSIKIKQPSGIFGTKRSSNNPSIPRASFTESIASQHGENQQVLQPLSTSNRIVNFFASSATQSNVTLPTNTSTISLKAIGMANSNVNSTLINTSFNPALAINTNNNPNIIMPDSLDVRKIFNNDHYFSDINPRSLRRLTNIVYVSGRLMKAFSIDFQWVRLATWINMIEQWPYRSSWIILYYEENEALLDSQITLKQIYDIVSPYIPTSREIEPFLEYDKNDLKLLYMLSGSSIKLTVTDMKLFLPFSVNLDPYIKKVIREHIGDLLKFKNSGSPLDNPYNVCSYPSTVYNIGTNLLNRNNVVIDNKFDVNHNNVSLSHPFVTSHEDEKLSPTTKALLKMQNNLQNNGTNNNNNNMNGNLSPPTNFSKSTHAFEMGHQHPFILNNRLQGITNRGTMESRTTNNVSPNNEMALISTFFERLKITQQPFKLTTQDICELMEQIPNFQTTQMTPDKPTNGDNSNRIETIKQYKRLLRENNVNGFVLLSCNLKELQELLKMSFGDWYVFMNFVKYLCLISANTLMTNDRNKTPGPISQPFETGSMHPLQYQNLLVKNSMSHLEKEVEQEHEILSAAIAKFEENEKMNEIDYEPYTSKDMELSPNLALPSSTISSSNATAIIPNITSTTTDQKTLIDNEQHPEFLTELTKVSMGENSNLNVNTNTSTVASRRPSISFAKNVVKTPQSTPFDLSSESPDFKSSITPQSVDAPLNNPKASKLNKMESLDITSLSQSESYPLLEYEHRPDLSEDQQSNPNSPIIPALSTPSNNNISPVPTITESLQGTNDNRMIELTTREPDAKTSSEAIKNKPNVGTRIVGISEPLKSVHNILQNSLKRQQHKPRMSVPLAQLSEKKGRRLEKQFTVTNIPSKDSDDKTLLLEPSSENSQNVSLASQVEQDRISIAHKESSLRQKESKLRKKIECEENNPYYAQLDYCPRSVMHLERRETRVKEDLEKLRQRKNSLGMSTGNIPASFSVLQSANSSTPSFDNKSNIVIRSADNQIPKSSILSTSENAIPLSPADVNDHNTSSSSTSSSSSSNDLLNNSSNPNSPFILETSQQAKNENQNMEKTLKVEENKNNNNSNNNNTLVSDDTKSRDETSKFSKVKSNILSKICKSESEIRFEPMAKTLDLNSSNESQMIVGDDSIKTINPKVQTKHKKTFMDWI